MDTQEINGGYTVRIIDALEMKRIQDLHFTKVFSNRANAVVPKLSADAIEKIRERASRFPRWELRLAVYQNEAIVGWHYGYATDPETYYMQNSAVLTEFRNRGIYSGLLKAILAHTTAEGFQVIISLHHPNNAAVIIPKLKSGFIITGSQFHERFRHLIEMKLFIEPARKRAYAKEIGLDLA